MKNNILTTAFIAVFVLTAVFSSSDVNAQSCSKSEKTICAKQNPQTLSAINAEILALEKELAQIEILAKQYNVDLGKPHNYMILNKTADVGVNEEKTTAKN